MANWWQYLTTQAFNPPVEPGLDIGTPFHTPVTALAPGTVLSESFGGFGARIDIKDTGGNVVEYYQHLDSIAAGLKVGSQVRGGQFLGLSGGQLSGGNLPNSPMNSTGPHIEVGLIGPGGRPMDPTATIKAGPSSTGVGGGSGGGGGGFFNPGGFLSWLGGVSGQAAAGDPAGAAGVAVGTVAAATGQGLVQGIGAGFAGVAKGLAPTVSAYIIPLVVAALIILVVLGTGQKQAPPAPAPQIVPIPV